MLVANGMVFVARIMTVDGTALVSIIMTDSAAIGSRITRTGQSTVNMTSKQGGTGQSQDPSVAEWCSTTTRSTALLIINDNMFAR